MIIKAELIGDAELAELFRAWPDTIESGVHESVARVTLRLQAKVQKALRAHKDTANLANLVTQRVAYQDGAIVGTVGSDVHQLAAQEYGLQDIQKVRMSLRQIKQAWGKALKTPHQIRVKAHKRAVKYPERAFLRTALREMQQGVATELRTALNAK